MKITTKPVTMPRQPTLIEREGVVSYGDARLNIWEDSIPSPHAEGGHKARDAWEAKFKKDVFTRVIQTLNRIGWTVEQPAINPHDVKHYGGTVARWATERSRNCSLGEIRGELNISGRSITFEMWQGVNTPTRPDHGGRYESNKEAVAPYLLRIEMDRTRNRIRDYLCNVFTGYTFKPKDPVIGLMGVTAVEKAAHDRRTSGHYKPALDHAEISMASNAVARDGGIIEHGTRVWAIDWHGRVFTGTAFYGLNNRWQIVTGRYGLTSVGTSEIFTQPPVNPRVKRNAKQRRKRLEGLLAEATKSMNFERAIVLRGLLFPTGEQLYVIKHADGSCYWAADSCGYRNDLADAGKYTADEARRVLGPTMRSSRGDHAIAI